MSDTSAQRRAQQAVERRRPAARGFEYRKRAPQIVDTDDITLIGGLPITGPTTITQVRTLTLSTPSTTSRISTTSSSSSASRTSTLNSQRTTTLETTERPTLEPSASPLPPPATGANAAESSPSVRSTTSLGTKGLSGGAIAGIAIAVVVVLAAIIVFLFRKRMISNRKDRRNNWSTGVSSQQPAMTTVPLNTPAIQAFRDASGYNRPSEPAPPVPPMPASLVPGDPRPGSVAIPPPPQAQPPVVVPPPPPSSFNPPIVGGTTVRCTFIPNLDDELWITTGETIKVLQEYDDGWALCENAGQQRGMVPVECLERGDGRAQDVRPNLKRASSLSNRSK